MRQLFRELKRRNVYRVAVTYAAAAFVTLQAARLVFPATTLEGLYDKLVVLAFVGFPIALVIAWAFELTPEGVRRTPGYDEDASSSAEARSGEGAAWSRAAVGALVGLGLLAATGIGTWYLLGSGGEQRVVTDRSIAVLPFENFGGTENRQFTEGVHDALLTRLSNVGDLRVTSRTSVMPYRDTDEAVPVIADSLGVSWVVEGAVQRMGERVQVNAQLIQAEADVHRWAKTYTRELDSESFFAIQDELTREIAATLETQLTSAEKERVARTPTRDLRAYQLYVQGRRELARRGQGNMTRAVRLFRRAIERDSNFAEAWSGLADAAGTEWWGFDGYDTLGVTPSAAAHRALELDPELPEAHASMGLVHYRARRGPEALRELERAVALRPSYAEAHNWLGLTLKVLGRPREALGHLELAEELDPRNLLARHYLYDTYVMLGRYEQGLEAIREQQRRYPEWTGPFVAETRALYALGRYEEARQVVRERLSGGWGIVYLVGIHTALGDTAAAREVATEIEEAGAPPITMAYVHAGFGNVDATLAAFEAVDEWGYVPTATLRYLTFPEGMNRIRTHSRYGTLLRRVNRAWGLNPDGSLPDSVDVSFERRADG